MEQEPHQRLIWLEQEAAYPGLSELIHTPLDELLPFAADQLVADRAAVQQRTYTDHWSNWAVLSSKLTLAENQYASETLEVQVAKGSLSVVYASQYKGNVGKLFRPNSPWAVAYDDTGSYYYWNEQRHGSSAGLFALAGTACDELPPCSVAVDMMRLYLGLVLYCRTDPHARQHLAVSTIAKPNLQTALPIQFLEI